MDKRKLTALFVGVSSLAALSVLAGCSPAAEETTDTTTAPAGGAMAASPAPGAMAASPGAMAASPGAMAAPPGPAPK